MVKNSLVTKRQIFKYVLINKDRPLSVNGMVIFSLSGEIYIYLESACHDNQNSGQKSFATKHPAH